MIMNLFKQKKLTPILKELVKDTEEEKAVFFGEGTVDEFKRQEEQDKGFIKKVFGL